MANVSTIRVAIPGASASRSKMQKKGWKCWAKWIDNVKSPANNGFAFDGQFVATGADVECMPGDLLLHVDESQDSGVGVVMANVAGSGLIKWIETTTAAKWAGTLAAPARRLLAMSREERIQHVAGLLVEDRPDSRTDEQHAHWVRLAGQQSAEPTLSASAETLDAIAALRTALETERLRWADDQGSSEAITDALDHLDRMLDCVADIGHTAEPTEN